MIEYQKKSWMEQFEPLKPSRSMDPYVPCWCNSGKKWKFCHKLREDAPALPAPKLQRKSFDFAKITETCLHPYAPETCRGKIAKAHTLQRSRALKAISEDGHVLSMKDGLVAESSNSNVDPTLMGINKASIFRGFCQRHDDEMFKQVDIGAINTDPDLAFLITFRAVCYEMHQKTIGLRTAQYFRDNLDRGMPFERQVDVQDHVNMMIHGFLGGIQDFKIQKAKFDTCYREQNYENVQTYSEVYQEIFPIAVSTAFSPEYSFAGRHLQTMKVAIGALDLLGFNIFSVGNETLVNFTWVGDDNGANFSFVKEYAALPMDIKLQALVVLAFEFTEHIFIKPSWWPTLESNVRRSLSDRWQNTPGDHKADCLSLPKQPFVEIGQFETFTNLSL